MYEIIVDNIEDFHAILQQVKADKKYNKLKRKVNVSYQTPWINWDFCVNKRLKLTHFYLT